MAMLAFAVDYGYVLKVRTDLQRTADTAALAAVQNLVPETDGTQDLAAVRTVLRTYATSNTNNTFQVLDADIEIGRYDPATIYSNLALLNSGTFDTVRVTMRYDGTANSPVPLFFSQALGINNASVTATAAATVQEGAFLTPGTEVLPFAIHIGEWDMFDPNVEWSIYGDGKVVDEYGNTMPGNWGTVDIGPTNNSTADLRDQILNGLRQSDLDALYSDGRIPDDTEIDASMLMWVEADPGLSSGIKSAVQAIHGQTRMVPLYDVLQTGGGNNLEYQIIQWGVVEVVDSNWQGANNTWVRVKKAYIYDGSLKPHPDLSIIAGSIEGTFTQPVLVE